MVTNISESVLLSDEDTAWLLLCFVWTGQMDGLQGEPGPAQHSKLGPASSHTPLRILNIIVLCLL